MKGSECCGAPCRFWLRIHDDEDAGQCRARPPAVMPALAVHWERTTNVSPMMAVERATHFPITDVHDWCGEFEADGFQGAC